MEACCRACLRLAYPDERRPLFPSDISDSSSTAELYSLFTSIEIKPKLDRPAEYICSHCEQTLINFQHFRDMCIQSDLHIRVNEQASIERAAGSSSEQPTTKIEPTSPAHHLNDESDPIRCVAILGNEVPNVGNAIDTKPQLPVSASVANIEEQPAVEPKVKSRVKKCSKLQCDLCGQLFTNKLRITAHLRMHVGLKPHACDDCPEAFGNYVSLRNHRSSEHGDTSHRFAGRQFACEVDGCTRSYGTRYNLRQHVERKHTKAPGRLMCETCGQVFHTRQALIDHMYRHSDPSTYPCACDICPKRFVNRYALDAHLKRHRNIRDFQCSECPQRTYSQYELSIHMEYHNKELSVQCEKCPNKFTTKMGLRRHMTRVHSGRKPYVCTHCGLGFAKKETMVNHTMRHTGEKPHACPICDQRFRQLVTMKTHLKVHQK